MKKCACKLSRAFNFTNKCVQHRLRVVPLFETVKDLRGAGSVIRKLLSIDWYRQHIIKNHNGHQEVLSNPIFIPFML